jgi:hypothetical protein
MVQTTTKFRFPFDDKRMLFDEKYPEELHAVFPREEFVATIRKLNYDLNQVIQDTSQDLKKWTTGTAIATCLLVGIFAVPVVWYKASKNQKAMEQFWTKVREYLTELNRRDLIRRGLEWKVVEEKSKIKGHDCVNKVYCMRIDLLWRTGIVKSKKALEREAAKRRGPYGTVGEETTTASMPGASASESTALATPTGYEPPTLTTEPTPTEEGAAISAGAVPMTEEAQAPSPIEEVTSPIEETEQPIPVSEEVPPALLEESPVEPNPEEPAEFPTEEATVPTESPIEAAPEAPTEGATTLIESPIEPTASPVEAAPEAPTEGETTFVESPIGAAPEAPTEEVAAPSEAVPEVPAEGVEPAQPKTTLFELSDEEEEGT